MHRLKDKIRGQIQQIEDTKCAQSIIPGSLTAYDIDGAWKIEKESSKERQSTINKVKRDWNKHGCQCRPCTQQWRRLMRSGK
jgi:hypothetical protein